MRVTTGAAIVLHGAVHLVHDANSAAVIALKKHIVVAPGHTIDKTIGTLFRLDGIEESELNARLARPLRRVRNSTFRDNDVLSDFVSEGLKEVEVILRSGLDLEVAADVGKMKIREVRATINDETLWLVQPANLGSVKKDRPSSLKPASESIASVACFDWTNGHGQRCPPCDAQRCSSPDGSQRSWLTVRWSGLLGTGRNLKSGLAWVLARPTTIQQEPRPGYWFPMACEFVFDGLTK